MVTLTIDGKKVVVEEGTNLVEAARTVGIEIPTLCYDRNLVSSSNCRLCVVEVEGVNKMPTACSTPVREGMVVHTETDKVVRSRKMTLRLMLDNHPNDCLSCNRAGRCDLQKYAIRYKMSFRNHDGARRGIEHGGYSDTSSPYILRDESKCIVCGKCVRTCAVVEERNVLSFANRGFYTRIVADSDQTLEDSSCVSCNRCVVACPVGALIDRRSADTPRIWQCERKVVTCKQCSFGCEMELYEKDNKVVAVRAKDPANGRPLCLKGRLRTELEYRTNVEKPYIKEKDENGKNHFIQTSWVQALDLDKLVDKI